MFRKCFYLIKGIKCPKKNKIKFVIILFLNLSQVA